MNSLVWKALVVIDLFIFLLLVALFRFSFDSHQRLNKLSDQQSTIVGLSYTIPLIEERILNLERWRDHTTLYLNIPLEKRPQRLNQEGTPR